jgi:integrase/recombinase XerD
MEIGKITVNPMSTLTFASPTTKPRQILTQKEIKTVFEACVTYRERAVLTFCYGLGLRRSEAVNMNLEDVNFTTQLAFVREGKGKKRRVIPMNETVIKNLKIYLESERISKETKAFITTKAGFKVSAPLTPYINNN